MPIVQQWIIKAAVGFVIRQVTKYGKTIKWELVKKDFAVRVADMVPGTWLDDEAIALSNAIIDSCAAVLRDVGRIERLVTLLAQEKTGEALTVLKDLLLGAFVPKTVEQKKFVAALAEKPNMLQFAA